MSKSDVTPITFYGAPMSLYSGKARAYFRKQGIPFKEVMPGHKTFLEDVAKKVQRRVVPVIEIDNGSSDSTLIQDTVDIIDHFENKADKRFSVYPQTPLQKLTALIIDLFGSEGLLKTAMHYRWSFLKENEGFIRYEFGDHAAPGTGRETVEAVADHVIGQMQAYLPKMDITERTIPAIEAQYADLLELLNKHFEHHPYLLGGLPSVGDYGLFAPMYAHLARDPYPSNIMKCKAQRVYRWVERMNAENSDMPEYPDYAETFCSDDEIPETLGPVLQLIAADFLPEMQRTVAEINNWLEENAEVQSGACVTAKPHIKALGEMSYLMRGTEFKGMVIPYRLYMLQRITDAYEAMSVDDKAKANSFFDAVGLKDMLTLKAKRRVNRENHIEVWGNEINV